MAQLNLTPLDLLEQVTPANPAAGALRVYAKSDDKLYVLTSAGAESQVGAGGGASRTFGFFMS